MDNGLTGLLGIARKAGKLEVGEESVSSAAKAHKARALLLASDAGERTRRHAESLVTGNCPLLPAPLTKAELGGAVGRGSCAILALTDAGLANAAAQKLEGVDPQIRQHLEYKAEKTLRRRRETRRREKETQRGKPWAPPPADQ
ncbi:MAG: 50S ribosomal protein L7 [Oscillospiraceae bacterium]|jgi:ribosomal protein L7Ae-like RNA K-turn-binding protein|nr:50S ribosomal protein L7 [Oscillospiraceae bacterium]